MVENFPIIHKHFQFKCTQCADCCTGDQTVLLNLFDLYKIGKHLKVRSTETLFKKSLIVLKKDAGNDVYRPVIRFKTKPFKFCPFLTNEWTDTGQIIGWCQLHPYQKPLACSLAPVGVSFDANTENLQFLLVPPTESCPGLKEPHSQALDQYLAPYWQEINYQNIFFKILEKLKTAGWSATEFQQNLYSFSLAKPFEEILAGFERRYLNKKSL